LLEPCGVTKRFLQNGWKLECMNFWCKNRLVYKNDYTKVKHTYPFMLIQPQYETESILEGALADRGIYAERGQMLEGLTFKNKTTEINFRNTENELTQINFEGIIIGADGSKSKVRECIRTEFKGWEHKEEFKLYDIELETPVTHKEGHYMLYKEGGMIMLHIRDGVWRVGGNIKDVLNYLPQGTKTGKITWETSFTVSEKIANKFRVGNVYLLGDAAHIHSPAGAKGMNMCIEDSYIFSKLLKENREHNYHDIRYPVIKRTIGILGQLTDKIGGHNFMGNTIRNNMNKFSMLFPVIMPKFRKFMLGIN
jgi:2-polyprenyl-6-methoxyphenol hydroxylase-like FAD-dependent oxidoreductase